jgi:hypothetical protein
MTSLYHALRDEEWDTVRLLCRSPTGHELHRERAPRIRDYDRRKLHMELNRRDICGATVLFYACSLATIPVDVVVALLDAASTATTPLTPVTMGTEVVTMDHAGSTLAHYAASSGSASTLAVLLQRMPRSNRIGTSLSYTPCRLAWHCYFRNHDVHADEDVDAPLLLPPLKERLWELTSAYSIESLPECVRQLWKKTMLLVRHVIHQRDCMFSSSEPDKAGNDLLSLICFGGLPELDCPTVAVWLAMQIVEHDLMAPIDGNSSAALQTEIGPGASPSKGNLVLHVAAASRPLLPLSPPPPPRAASYLARQANGAAWAAWAHSTVVTQLCHLAPSAAAVPNRYPGQYPLHIAIASGQPWYGGIQVLLQAYSPAIVIPDPVSGLEPLLQAANAKRCSLTTLFEMMRHNADLVFASD